MKAFDGLEPARDNYGAVASKLARVAELIPFRGPASQVEKAALPEAISLIAQSAEHEARAAIERALS